MLATALAVLVSPGLALSDPAWRGLQQMATPRYGHSATLLSSGEVLVAGGADCLICICPPDLASAELFDPSSGTWSSAGSMAGPRISHTATWLPSENVLVAGGEGAGPDGGVVDPIVLSSAELYDVATGTFSLTGSLAEARSGHTATFLPTGKVLVAGGLGSSGTLASAELYDPTVGVWSATQSMLNARSGHTATLLPSGKVLVAGGVGSSGALASAELFDPTLGAWSATQSMLNARSGHTATLLLSGEVLVADGDVAGTAELYDEETGTWTMTGPSFGQAYVETATLLLSGQVLLVGEVMYPHGQADMHVQLYDPATATWSATASLISSYQAATRLASGEVLVSGGRDDYYGCEHAVAEAAVYEPEINISPPSVTLVPKGSQAFTASGGSGAGYTWALRANHSSGSISPTGAYTAGSTGGVTDTVQVTDSVGDSATAMVTVSGGGCATTGGDTFPHLALLALPLILRQRRRVL
ncbi:MAG: kelch repeat-containing protein [Myxococcaceae bacterium]